MRTEVVHPARLDPAALARWRELQREQPALGSPFLAPEFTVAVGRLRPGARVAVLRDGDEIVGFFPFERRAPRYGVPIAAGLTDVQGLVHAPGLRWEPRELLAACRLDVWEFDRLVVGQQPFERYARLRAPSPVIDLAEGAGPVLTRLSRRSGRVGDKLPRQRRKLARDVGPLRFEFGSRDPADLDRVMRWKSAQYRRTGRSDRFAHPWIVRLLVDLQQRDPPGAQLVVSTLYAGDRAVAAHVGLRLGPVLAGWFPEYDVEFARYSPGMLHRLDLIEAAAAAGIRSIELGRGAKDSKELFKTHDDVVAEGAVVLGPLGAVLYHGTRAPVRRLRQVVTDSPRLYRAADRVLTRCAAARAALPSVPGRSRVPGRSPSPRPVAGR